MSHPILAVDKDVEIFEQERAGWVQRGIDALRVNSMCEAMEELSRNSYLFVAINADNINYMPMLLAMRKASSTSLFVLTSKFNIQDQVAALHSGANVYAPRQASTEENVMSALALLYQYGEQAKRRRKQPKPIPHRKLIVLPGPRQVFGDDEEISLTKTEYDLLLYLLANRGITVTFQQIYRSVWGNGYDDTTHRSIWNHVLRLRKKITEATGEDDYIKTVRDVGYMLTIPPKTTSQKIANV